MYKLLDQIRSLPAQFTGFTKEFRLFMITVLAYGMVVEGISMVLLNLFLLRLGYGTEFIGALNSAGITAFAIVSLPVGAVTRISSKRMLQYGQLLSLVGLVGLPLSAFATTNQAALLITFRIIGMLGLSCYFVHQLPFAMEITRSENHSRVLAVTMATFSLAAFFGSWVGGMMPGLFGRILALPLTSAQPYQYAMLTATLAIIPAILAVHNIPDGYRETRDGDEALISADITDALFSRRSIIVLVLVIIVVRALQTGGVGVMLTFTNVYFDDALGVPTSRIGLISGLGRLLGVPMSLLVPLLVTRYGNFRLIHISLGLIVLLMMPVAFVAYWPVAALAYIGINSMGSLRYLSFIAFTMSLVPDNQRSLMSGAGEMAIGAGFAMSSFVGGYLIAWYGYRELFLFGAGLTIIGTVAFWAIFRSRAATMTSMPIAAPTD